VKNIRKLTGATKSKVLDDNLKKIITHLLCLQQIGIKQKPTHNQSKLIRASI
jgi:hypothetical protein